MQVVERRQEQAAEESSGLYNPFPQSPACSRQGECHFDWFGTRRQGRILFRSPASPPWIPAFAGMTSGAGMKEMEEYLKGVARNKKPRHSGLRRNDDEGINNRGESERYLATPPPSFQRKLESSGLYNPFPQSGNAIVVGLVQADRARFYFAPRHRLPGFQLSLE